jgi:hypothetical protein
MVPIGTVPGDQKGKAHSVTSHLLPSSHWPDRDEIFSLLQWFHPTRGPGRTEHESAVRGLEGAMLQLTKRQAQAQPEPTYLSMASKPDVGPPPITHYVQSDPLPTVEETHQKWGFAPWQPPPLPISELPEHSPLSTGEFIHSSRRTVMFRPEMEELGTHALQVAVQAREHWHSAQQWHGIACEQWIRSLSDRANPPHINRDPAVSHQAPARNPTIPSVDLD